MPSITIWMVASLAPEEAEQYALRMAEHWKLGRKKIDDGAILVIARNDRAMRIDVGHGMGARHGGAGGGLGGGGGGWSKVCRQIEAAFRQLDFEGGVVAGVQAVTGHLKQHFPPDINDRNELPNKPVVLSGLGPKSSDRLRPMVWLQ